MTTDKAALSDELVRRLSSQIAAWRSDLLTLDRRQKLVYFKHTRSASFEIASPGPAELFTALNGTLQLQAEEAADGRARGRILIADKTEAEVAAGARRLDLTSQQVYADRGFWTLYLGLGLLGWVDPADGKEAEAPIILCPVRIHRAGTQEPFNLSRTEDDLVINPALRLHLEKSFNLRLPSVDPDVPGIGSILEEVESLVRDHQGWSVQRRAVLTTFSFHKEAIYRDLEDHEATVTAHPIVQLIALGADAPSAASFDFNPPGTSGSLDEEHPPEELMSILDADSSQRTCVLAAREGRSFVMDGPPGTGKSQTIANIIAELISSNRTVLFVSEKAAALDVVRDRLASKGLGDFTLELHSHAATRKEVVKQLADSLSQRATARGVFTEGEKRHLQSTRAELTGYAAAMNEQRPRLGRSLFAVLGRLAALQPYEHRPLDDVARWASLGSVDLSNLLDTAERLAHAWRPVSEGDDYLWRDLKDTAHGPAEVDKIKTATKSLADATRMLDERCRAVDSDLGLVWGADEASARRRLDLLRLLERRPDVPLTWFTISEPDALVARVDQLRRAVDSHRAALDALAEIVGPDSVDHVDPEACARLNDLGPYASLVWSPRGDTDDTALAASIDLLQGSPVTFASIVEDVRQLGAMLGVSTEDITLRRAVEISHLAALAGSAALPERAWLNPAVQAALQESTRVLGSVVELVNYRRTSVEQVFTPAALDADLAGLDVRFRETHRGLRAFSGAARADKRALKAITVSGKADKTVRSRLGEAVAWQKAEHALDDAERQHAGQLGSYYERTSTDFGRIGEAIRTAQSAIALAGNDLNAGPMSDQLSRDGRPDPRLTVIARRMLENATAWSSRAVAVLGSAAEAELAGQPLDLAAGRSADAAVALVPLHQALTHVAVLARRSLTLDVGREARARAIALSEALVAIFDHYERDVAALGPLYSGLTTRWALLDEALAWLKQTRQVIGGPVSPQSAERMNRPIVLAAELEQRIDEWALLTRAFADAFVASRGAELLEDLAADLADGTSLLLEMFDTCAGDIGEWDAFVLHRHEVSTAGLADVLDLMIAKKVPADDVVPGIERSILQAWAESVIADDPRLKRHRASDRDALVDRFRELDLAVVNQAHLAVAAACSARRPNSVSGTSAQLIRREAQKKSRHLPIREILSRTGEIVQELKPCFMMSPLSVSQFLPGDMTFDAVIFDEASQVLPSDAINCIYRGAQLIVAGDEKQLPPTSFFTQAVSDDDTDEELDLFESVLKSCKSSLPSLPLNWHYRSQHESLITYSNYRFYAPDGQALQTFPGATFESPDLGVASYVVNGIYRKGGARDNPIEADAVVDRLLFHRENHPTLSIGVVTFSTAQEEAITGALERRAATEPALAGLLDSHDRLTGFFVKNLENVQGDERDIIIFSIGYGPDETGKFSMNFGPINRDGGWRRLNVAITRARRRVEVVSSFRAGDMRDTTSDGLRHLRGYLDFAERGIPALSLDTRGSLGDAESPFEEDVLAVISSWGYDVVTQVGSAGYRIDLGVKHPDRPGEYVLAVECDGAAYHSAATARDRDRLRSGVLQGLGWKIHRIWGISWYRDRHGESLKLRAAIEAAIAGSGGGVSFVAPPVVSVEMESVDLEAPPDWTVPYVADTGRAFTPHPLASVEARPSLSMFIARVVEAESPVHHDILYRRIRDGFGVGRIGHAIKANIEFVASRLTVEGVNVKLDEAGFYRIGSAREVRTPRDEDDVRTVHQTPPDELDLAVARIVRDAVTIEDEGVTQAVRSVFGWRRAGGDIQAAIAASVDRCLRMGSVERTGRGTLRAVSR